MSTTTELLAANERYQRLRAAVEGLADEAVDAHEKHLHFTRRSAPNHRPCESGARAMFAKRIYELLATVDS